MSLPDNFALLALNPSIRENDGFLFLQTGAGGYIDVMIQSATGIPANILKIASGVSISNTLYVNKNGNDQTAKKETIDFPFKTIKAALNQAGANDTIEVFPGAYDVSGNLYKEGVSFYFHKNSSVNFIDSGKLFCTGSDTGIFNIFGHGNFINAGAGSQAFKISGGQIVIEFDSFNCDNSNFIIDGVANSLANVTFKTIGEGDVYGGKFSSTSLTINNASARFEKIEFDNGRVQISNASKLALFDSCSFKYNDSSFSNPVYQFTGKIELKDCEFTNSYPRMIGSNNFYVKNAKFAGGVISSGSLYLDNCVFDTSNSLLYPSQSLINHLGGDSIFSNCYVKNFNNTSNVQYTFRPSGSLAGSSNFNINGSFSSFVPNFSGTNVQYGIFSYNPSLK